MFGFALTRWRPTLYLRAEDVPAEEVSEVFHLESDEDGEQSHGDDEDQCALQPPDLDSVGVALFTL